MPKRFTATEKWDDPWFWELSPTAKLLWLFLCDHCDNAGIIEISLNIATAKLGLAVNEKHRAELQSRLHALPCGKFIIIGFIRFQYGPSLNPECKPHASVFASLSRHGTDITQIQTLSKGLSKGSLTLQDKDKDKDKLVGGCGGKESVDAIYAAYPLKVGKPKALVAIRGAIARGTSADALLAKTKEFSAARGDDLRYCPHPSTWFNQDRFNDDPKTWMTTENSPPKPPPPKTIEDTLLEETKRRVARLNRELGI